jgi:two-component system cell cycle sensor histidine kinase/response regulator CckA
MRVILSSGYSIEGQAATLLKKGCDGFIQKPYNLNQLAEKIKEILA